MPKYSTVWDSVEYKHQKQKRVILMLFYYF